MSRANRCGSSDVGTAMMTTIARSGGAEVAQADILTDLYTAHYRGLVRLAAYLTGDPDGAEEVVQDAYVKVHGAWGGLKDLTKGEAYLRTAVVNLSRSRLRRRQVAARYVIPQVSDAASAETSALAHAQRDAVLKALQALPRRQREAVVLRYYSDLTESQTATAMACSTGSVKSYTSRAMASLRPLLEEIR